MTLIDKWPAARVAPVVAAWIEAWDRKHGLDDPESMANFEHGPMTGRDFLTFHAGVNRRQLYQLLNHDALCVNKRGKTVPRLTATRFDLVDRLFMAMDLTHLFHFEPEDGGFADLYAVTV